METATKPLGFEQKLKTKLIEVKIYRLTQNMSGALFSCRTTVEIAEKKYFHNVIVIIVSEMPSVEILIGIDFLYRHGALIDSQFGRLIIQHQNILIRLYNLNTPFSVRVAGQQI